MARPETVANRLRIGRKRKLIFSLLCLFVSAGLIELGLRLFFAVLAGPHVLFYGTEFALTRDAQPRGSDGVDAPQGEIRALEGYSKYRPGEVRADRDPETGEQFFGSP
jgi:hypothetical protein